MIWLLRQTLINVSPASVDRVKPRRGSERDGPSVEFHRAGDARRVRHSPHAVRTDGLCHRAVGPCCRNGHIPGRFVAWMAVAVAVVGRVVMLDGVGCHHLSEMLLEEKHGHQLKSPKMQVESCNMRAQHISCVFKYISCWREISHAYIMLAGNRSNGFPNPLAVSTSKKGF